MSNQEDLEKIRYRLQEINKQISKNRKEILKRHLKLPVLNATFFFAIFGFIACIVFSIFISQYVKNVLYQMIFLAILPFTVLLIALFWGDIPEENLTNGINTIETKHKNLILKRHRRVIKKVLRKPFNLWGKDEWLLLRFESLE